MFDCSIKGQNIHLAKSLLDFASCHMKFAKIMKTGKIRQPDTLQKNGKFYKNRDAKKIKIMEIGREKYLKF